MSYSDDFEFFLQAIGSPKIEEIQTAALPVHFSAEEEGANPYSDLRQAIDDQLSIERLAEFGRKEHEFYEIQTLRNQADAEAHRLFLLDQGQKTTWRTRAIQRITQQCLAAEAAAYGGQGGDDEDY